MKIVVTGGGGYVGYHIGWAVSQGGHEVILVDLNQPDSEWKTKAPKVLFDALPKGFWGNDEVIPRDLQYIKANITCFDSLKEIFHGASAVIHTASYGISGQEQLSAHMTKQEEVNIEGTKTVIRAAVECKVRALVYTSTYNVVFGGEEIKDGDESLPYYPLHCHSDHYSRTKAIAETLVLMSNGKYLGMETLDAQTDASTQDRNSFVSVTDTYKGLKPLLLRTCALRLAGVMGLGERRHSNRVIDALQSGFLCTYGKAEHLVDFVGIQNVVQAHIKAMKALLQEQDKDILGHLNKTKFLEAAKEVNSVINEEKVPKSDKTFDPTGGNSSIIENTKSDIEILRKSQFSERQVSGKAFFISDGSPINHFEYFRPWYEGLGYGFPAMSLPLILIMIVAHIQEFAYLIIHKIFPFKPFITPAEVYKSGVTHYFSIKKAETYFGYKPTRPNDQSQIVEYYINKGCTRDNEAKSITNIFVFSGIVVLVMYIFYLIMA